MDFLLNFAHQFKDWIIYSAFIAPILFYATKKPFLGTASLLGLGFAVTTLYMYESNLSLTAVQTRVFLYLAHSLNICATASTFVYLLQMRKRETIIAVEDTGYEMPVEFEKVEPELTKQEEIANEVALEQNEQRA